MKTVWLGFGILLFVLGLSGLAFWAQRTSRRLSREFAEDLHSRGFRPHPHCPIADIFGKTARMPTALSCYEGQIRKELPVVLIFTATTSMDVNSSLSVRNFLSMYFPPEAKLDDSWLSGWQEKMRTGKSSVLRAERTSGGGILIMWPGSQLRLDVEARIAEILQSLQFVN